MASINGAPNAATCRHTEKTIHKAYFGNRCTSLILHWLYGFVTTRLYTMATIYAQPCAKVIYLFDIHNTPGRKSKICCEIVPFL